MQRFVTSQPSLERHHVLRNVTILLINTYKLYSIVRATSASKPGSARRWWRQRRRGRVHGGWFVVMESERASVQFMCCGWVRACVFICYLTRRERREWMSKQPEWEQRELSKVICEADSRLRGHCRIRSRSQKHPRLAIRMHTYTHTHALCLANDARCSKTGQFSDHFIE